MASSAPGRFSGTEARNGEGGKQKPGTPFSRRGRRRGALQIEMLMNAQRLQTAANIGQNIPKVAAASQDTPAKFQKLLSGRDFSAVFRAYFIDAMDGVAWMDIDCVLDAYDTGGLLFEGNLVADPIGGGWYLWSADEFCKAIRAMSKYGKLEDSFYEEVEKLEKSLLRHGPQKGLPADSQP